MSNFAFTIDDDWDDDDDDGTAFDSEEILTRLFGDLFERNPWHIDIPVGGHKGVRALSAAVIQTLKRRMR